MVSLRPLLLLFSLAVSSAAWAAVATHDPCDPPDIASRPSYLRPGLEWEDALKAGAITFAKQSPRGIPLRSLRAKDLAGTFDITAVVTNGRDTGQTLTGQLILYIPPGPHPRSAKGGICSGTCRDTVWHWSDTFDLVGSGDSRIAAWPLVAMGRVASADSSSPGVEAAFGSDALFEFSLGPGLRGDDGPPRFTITEAMPPVFRGWWGEGAPIGRPNGGYFCMTQVK